MFTIAIWFVKWFCKTVGNKKGKVCILTAKRSIRVRMSIYSVDTFYVFSNNVTVRIHTESTNTVAILFCTVNELWFIYNICNVFEYSGRKFNTNPDIYLIINKFNSKILALICKPFGTTAAGSGNQILTTCNISLFCYKLISFRTSFDLRNSCIKMKIHFIF